MSEEWVCFSARFCRNIFCLRKGSNDKCHYKTFTGSSKSFIVSRNRSQYTFKTNLVYNSGHVLNSLSKRIQMPEIFIFFAAALAFLAYLINPKFVCISR